MVLLKGAKTAIKKVQRLQQNGCVRFNNQGMKKYSKTG